MKIDILVEAIYRSNRGIMFIHIIKDILIEAIYRSSRGNRVQFVAGISWEVKIKPFCNYRTWFFKNTYLSWLIGSYCLLLPPIGNNCRSYTKLVQTPIVISDRREYHSFHFQSSLARTLFMCLCRKGDEMSVMQKKIYTYIPTFFTILEISFQLIFFLFL
jgi:hypothetical protein